MRGLTMLGCCGLLLLAGCGGGAGEAKPCKVEGRVYYRGAPVPGGTIVFSPDPEQGGHGPLAVGVIQADGRYNLRTGGELGAVAGWHRVTVAPAAVEDRPFVQSIPDHYSDPQRSGKTCEVKAGQANVIDIHLD
jgi:hypothetical protein